MLLRSLFFLRQHDLLSRKDRVWIGNAVQITDFLKLVQISVVHPADDRQRIASRTVYSA